MRVEGKNNSVLNQLFYFRELRKEQRRRYYERIKQMERDLDTNDDDDHEDSRNKKEIQEIAQSEKKVHVFGGKPKTISTKIKSGKSSVKIRGN